MSNYPGQGCTPAKDRLGPFGHSVGAETHDQQAWDSIRWGSIQSQCATKFMGTRNADPEMSLRRLKRATGRLDEELNSTSDDDRRTGRIAVVLRTWDEYAYSNNQLAWMRAMITELSLDTGGRYQVFLLVNVKDETLDLNDEEVYMKTLERSVPRELRDAALLYNEPLLREWFPKVGEHGAQDQMYQALQVFSQTFPEFDNLWQLEMDVRFTGNVASMLTNAASWARRQPRKNLWERNGRFYIPGLWENYLAFSADVDAEFAGGSGVWGPPQYAAFFVEPQGPKPPEKTDLTWGVGEEAELITFSPLIDPITTKWTYESAVHGFEPALNLPRRMAIVSMTRVSRRLLRLISAEQRATGSWVVSEATPETWSLLHGLKAVYVPHLIAFNSSSLKGEPDSTALQLDEALHTGPPWSLAGGEHASFLWCHDIGLPEKRWLEASYFYWAGDAPHVWWDYTNGTCTYPLLLHPVKND